MSISTRLPIARAVALALAAASPAVWAAQPNNDALEEVVVTAQFRDQNLQETPIAITAITGDMLEARSQVRLVDVTAQAPNVILQVNPAGAGNSMRAYIRGVGQGDQSPSVDPGVGIYVDDVYFATITSSIFELLDLERVEILRGPQGTLSGMNSLGGAVKLFSRKPAGEGGFVEGTLGSLNRKEFRGSADFALVPDRLFARISGLSRSRDGYVTRLDYACTHPNDPYVVSGAIGRGNAGPNCKIGTLGGQSVNALRGSLRWIASDSVEVNVIADTTHDSSETPASVLLQSGEFIPGLSLSYQGVPYDDRFVPYGQFRADTVMNDPFVSYANFINPGVTYTPLDVPGTPGSNNGTFYATPANTSDSWGASATIDWKVPDRGAVKSITAYREYETLSGADNDGSPVAILASLSEFRHNQFSQELRYNGEALDKRLEYTVGGIYFRQETVYETRESDPFIPFGPDPFNFPIFDFIQDDTTLNEFYGAFVHSIWHVTDKLNLTAGLRYTKQDKDYTFQRYNVDGRTAFQPLSDPANPLNGRVGNFSGSHTDYRLNLDYQWTQDLMTYVQFSTGFKGGGVSPRPYFPEQVLGFGPEEMNAYELGLKSRWFERRLQANAAVFYNDYKDYQATPDNCIDADGNLLPDAPVNLRSPCGQYLNVADAKVKGAELELEIRPIDGMLIDAAYSYVDFTFGEPKIATAAVIAGASAPGIGKNKWSVGAQYEIPLSSGATITPRVDAYYTPGYCGNLECTSQASNTSYTLVNVRLTYRTADDDWNISLEGTNLTDKLYYLNKFYAGTYTAAQPGTPAAWGLTVRRRF
ncbi:MAG: TonB-dependent receptor [Nevskiaceae bacterium]|nr:TonB-dependent receptor [Nevskiaceae bacterium]